MVDVISFSMPTPEEVQAAQQTEQPEPIKMDVPSIIDEESDEEVSPEEEIFPLLNPDTPSAEEQESDVVSQVLEPSPSEGAVVQPVVETTPEESNDEELVVTEEDLPEEEEGAAASKGDREPEEEEEEVEPVPEAEPVIVGVEEETEETSEEETEEYLVTAD